MTGMPWGTRGQGVGDKGPREAALRGAEGRAGREVGASPSSVTTSRFSFNKGSPLPSPVDANKPLVENILKDFANEVAQWRRSPQTNPSPVQFASYLSDYYLCEKLDPLPKSKMVTIARKAVSMEVEKISRIQSDKNNAPATKNVDIQNKRSIKRQTMIRNGQRRMANKPQKAAGRGGRLMNSLFPTQINTEEQDQPISVSIPTTPHSATNLSSASSFDDLVARIESQQSQLNSIRERDPSLTPQHGPYSVKP